jgi:1,2-diacylglycerol 3-alpha-glucosyltransferase
MKIVFVIDTYNDSSGGGIATKRLVTELRRRGHQVRIVAAVHENATDPDFYKVDGLVLYSGLNTRTATKFCFGKRQEEVISRALIDADIVQVQYPFVLGMGVVKMAKKLKIPCVGALHLQPQNILEELNLRHPLFQNLVWQIFNYLLFRRVKTIVTPSKFASKLMSSKGIKADIRTISNGVPKEYASRVVAKPSWFGRHFVILSIGRLAKEKRHEIIIEGVKRSKYSNDIQLIISGRGVRDNYLRDLGKNLPIEPFIGFVSHDEKLRLLNSADLYVHSSVAELESLSSLEALASGLPCLISNSEASAASKFSLDSRLLFKTDDADDLADKINYWYEHRDELTSTEMKTKAFKMASGYALEVSVDKYEQLYKEVIEGEQSLHFLS